MSSMPEYYQSICSGLCAFKASLVVQLLHPLEVIKTRIQSNDGLKDRNLVPKYNNLWDATKQILKQEGLQGLYRGMFFTMSASSISAFTFFGLYEFIKNKDQKIIKSSILASMLATVLVCPFWVLKTRIVLNTQNVNEFQNLKQSFFQIYNQYGWKGFYRGLSLSLMLSFHGSIQISIYEFMNIYRKDAIFSNNLFLNTVPNAFISKIIASYSMYPLTVLRTRYQQDQFLDQEKPKYKSIIDIIQKINQNEGIKGYYKGIIPSLSKNLPANAIFFYFYEFFKKFNKCKGNI